jgi:hypothetical protein
MCNLVTAPDQQRAEGQLATVEIFRLDMRADAGKPVWQKAEIAGVGNCQHSSTPFVHHPVPFVSSAVETLGPCLGLLTRTRGILNVCPSNCRVTGCELVNPPSTAIACPLT